MRTSRESVSAGRWEGGGVGSDLVSLRDTLRKVVAGQGINHGLPAEQLGVECPRAQRQGHVVDVDQLESRGAYEAAEQPRSVLLGGAPTLPLTAAPQHRGGEGNRHVGVDLPDVGSLDEVPGGIRALVPQHLERHRVSGVSNADFWAPPLS
jgi:hypothetical protein